MAACQFGRAATIAALGWQLMAASGCQYLEMINRHRALREEFEDQPRLALQRSLAPEKCLRVAGPIVRDAGPSLPMAVVAIGRRYDVDEVVGWRAVTSPLDQYSLLVPGGEYQLLALADLDGNGVYEADEVVGCTPPDQPVVVRKRVARAAYLVDGPAITIDRHQPQRAPLALHVEVAQQGHIVRSLDDDFFNPGWGEVGLFDPDRFMVHTQGYVFTLEEFDPRRTQVLFVHGALGTPRNFAELTAGLDQKQFQPVYFYYPSGLPLQQTATILEDLLRTVAAHPTLRPRRLAIVAHSMGGLVARMAVASLSRAGQPSWLSLFVTLASPYGGMYSAGLAVEQAPEMVPSWADLAPGSPFLDRLAETTLPPALPFFVLFAYDNAGSFRRGVSGDSVVPLSSQIPRETQVQADRLFGIDTTHAGILRDPRTRTILNSLLARYAAPQGVLGRTAQTISETVSDLWPLPSKSPEGAPP